MCYRRVLHVNRLPSSPSERLGSFDFVFGCAWGNLGGGTVQAYSGRYALWNMNVSWEKTRNKSDTMARHRNLWLHVGYYVCALVWKAKALPCVS